MFLPRRRSTRFGLRVVIKVLPPPHLLLAAVRLSADDVRAPAVPAWTGRAISYSFSTAFLMARNRGGTLGDPGAWFLGSTAFAAVGFAEPEPTEMTVDELKLQARASGGHDLRTSSPSACACSPSTTTRPASRSSRTSCSAASTM
ncbi:ubiquitin carrier protein 7 [Zea mays]|uniref:Ubiquitin carrier protein 7 n=1 Tax=Zea mays TaxID=4577 RepID=A0A1D6EQA8_MAIZE|nr:ubiquitin carrier protein 7 [Zea mays]